MLIVCDCILKYWIVIFQICAHDVRVVDTGPRSSPDTRSVVRSHIREILVPRHWPAAATSHRGYEHGDKSVSLLKGVILVGPIVEHNGDGHIYVDLQHKDCACGMAYYEEKGTRCRASNEWILATEQNTELQSGGLSVCVKPGPG